MHPPSGETITLTDEQRARARTLYNRVREGEVQSPNDIVDSWRIPTSSIEWTQQDSEFPHHTGFIPPDAIVGPVSDNKRMEKGRLKGVLTYLLRGEFEVQNSYPPMLQKRGSQFYVTDDGNHRSMVAKAIGLERLYVSYSEVPLDLLDM